MIKLVLKFLNSITSQINQLPNKSEQKNIRSSPINQSKDLTRRPTRPKSDKLRPMDKKRKGPPHSDEVIFNRGP